MKLRNFVVQCLLVVYVLVILMQESSNAGFQVIFWPLYLWVWELFHQYQYIPTQESNLHPFLVYYIPQTPKPLLEMGANLTFAYTNRLLNPHTYTFGGLVITRIYLVLYRHSLLKLSFVLIWWLNWELWLNPIYYDDSLFVSLYERSEGIQFSDILNPLLARKFLVHLF